MLLLREPLLSEIHAERLQVLLSGRPVVQEVHPADQGEPAGEETGRRLQTEANLRLIQAKPLHFEIAQIWTCGVPQQQEECMSQTVPPLRRKTHAGPPSF